MSGGQKPKVEWLKEVPQGWKEIRLKNVIKSKKGGIWGEEPSGLIGEDIVCVRVADFNRVNCTVNESSFTFRKVPDSHRRGRVLNKGDLLLEKSGGGDKQLVGQVVLFDLDVAAVCSNFISRLEVDRGLATSRFLNYVFNSIYGMKINGRSINQTTGIQNLNESSYLNEVCVFPPLDTQRQIAAFLDRKTLAIDALIDKKQRMIALLEERSALINHVVTKGLNPDAPMKDSGIPWIGMIPEKWQCLRIAQIASKITNGYVGPTRGIYRPEGVNYIQSLHIKKGKIVFNEHKSKYFVSKDWSEAHGKSVLNAEDVLLVQTGDIGQVSVVGKEYAGSNCHALIILSPKPEVGFGDFISWCLKSHYGYNSLKLIQTGALHPHLNCGLVREIYLPMPDVETQGIISELLHAECGDMQRAKALLLLQIDKLKEYRQALITAAVTGKLDVSAHGLSEDVEEDVAASEQGALW